MFGSRSPVKPSNRTFPADEFPPLKKRQDVGFDFSSIGKELDDIMRNYVPTSIGSQADPVLLTKTNERKKSPSPTPSPPSYEFPHWYVPSSKIEEILKDYPKPTFAQVARFFESKKKETKEEKRKEERNQCLYVLECADGKWYVGKTASLCSRFSSHLEGSKQLASTGENAPTFRYKWTSVHAPLKLVYVSNYFPYLEDAVTLRLMEEIGFEEVRGGRYTFLVLTDEQKKSVEASVMHESGRCFTCWEKGHFSSACPKKSPPKVEAKRTTPVKVRCLRCGRNNHDVDKCYATTHLNGKSIKR